MDNPLTWDTKDGHAWHDRGFCFIYDLTARVFGAPVALVLDQNVEEGTGRSELLVALMSICMACGDPVGAVDLNADFFRSKESCLECGEITPDQARVAVELNDSKLTPEASVIFQEFLEANLQRVLNDDPLIASLKATVAREAFERLIVKVVELAALEDTDVFMAKWSRLSRHFMVENRHARALLHGLSTVR